MSRLGKEPISIPKGVEVKVSNLTVSVKGPKGSLSCEVMDGIELKISDDTINVILGEKLAGKNNFHGLYRAVIDNMVIGVTKAFEKHLELVGVGFRGAVQGNQLNLQLGFSHPTMLDIPEGIQVKVDKNTNIIITGADKQLVGQFAANVRSLRKPEPYKGKGIHYKGEYVRRKAGKSGSK